jgi:hypothetical protein
LLLQICGSKYFLKKHSTNSQQHSKKPCSSASLLGVLFTALERSFECRFSVRKRLAMQLTTGVDMCQCTPPAPRTLAVAPFEGRCLQQLVSNDSQCSHPANCAHVTVAACRPSL